MKPTVRKTLATEAIDPPAQMIVYVCPTEGCGNFYSARNFRPDRNPKIKEPQTQRSQNDGSASDGPARIECPDCRALRSLTVKRVPYVVTAVVKLEDVVKEVARG